MNRLYVLIHNPHESDQRGNEVERALMKRKRVLIFSLEC